MGGAAVAQSNTEADILKVDTRFKYNFVVTNFYSATMLLSHFTASHMIFPLSYFRPVPLNRPANLVTTSLDSDALLLCLQSYCENFTLASLSVAKVTEHQLKKESIQVHFFGDNLSLASHFVITR